MKNIDYKSLRLLNLVIQEQGFEKAAKKSPITQSAISQRIRQLEKDLNQLLLTRTIPPKPTEYGKKLLGLLHQVDLLEYSTLTDKMNSVSLPLAINADSLATWFLPALEKVLENNLIKIHIILDDETRNLDHLLNGEVVGAISTQQKPINGGTSDHIGTFEYILVSTPQFAEKYFPSGVTKDSLLKAPIVSFQKNSDSHITFLQDFFNIPHGYLITHVVPSSEAYTQLILQNSACCMIAKQQIKPLLENGSVVNLIPDLIQYKKLYWHKYDLQSEIMENITEQILTNAKKFFS
ncbi:MAG: LysR family transcriptional regulator ArgP [[Pasteurella] aerogenes]|nr:LysR family transcriptional regulator ArgP [[Pasteurella] aerogenes]